MCYITATQLKNNLSYYMELSNSEDVYVTKNNSVITVLTSPRQRALKQILKYKGILKDIDLKGKSYKDIVIEEIEKR